ncbi:MAG: DUF3810 domain-containing protein [Christensenellales bacterium]|jgi:hypothetical protein
MTNPATHTRYLGGQLLRLLPAALVSGAIYLLVRIAPAHPQTVERVYAQGVYPAVSAALGALTGWFSFSLGEALLALGALGVLALITAAIVQAVRARRLWWRPAVALLRRLMCIGLCLYSLFYALWGFNHFRPSYGELAGLPVAPRDGEALCALCVELADQANALRAKLPEDAQGCFQATVSARQVCEKAPEAYRAAAATYPLLSGTLSPVKGVAISEALSHLNITGIYCPYTAEANLNVNAPQSTLPLTACHELAHRLGFAREDEATFLGYLACTASDDAAFAYSGLFTALIHAGNALYAEDPEAYSALWARYSPALARDMAQNSAYWDQYQGKAEEIQRAVNDQYLKGNGQSAGVKSYGMVVDLLLALRAEAGALPTPAALS